MRPTLIALAAASMLVVGCNDESAAPKSLASAAAQPKMSAKNQSATYAGTTLTVEGVAYERARGVRECGPHVCVPTAPQGEATIVKGALIVGVRTASASAARARLAALGLAVTRELSAGSTLLIAVPPLFEAQWLAALQQEKVFEYVEFDGVVSTQNR